MSDSIFILIDMTIWLLAGYGLHKLVRVMREAKEDDESPST
jgi:hypothetical protein